MRSDFSLNTKQGFDKNKDELPLCIPSPEKASDDVAALIPNTTTEYFFPHNRGMLRRSRCGMIFL